MVLVPVPAKALIDNVAEFAATLSDNDRVTVCSDADQGNATALGTPERSKGGQRDESGWVPTRGLPLMKQCWLLHRAVGLTYDLVVRIVAVVGEAVGELR